MKLRLYTAILITKLLVFILRLFRQGGTTLPGKFVLRLFPDILVLCASCYRIIMVTGTNGKTTTSRIIAKVLEQNNIEYIENKSGANLAGGIATTLLLNLKIKDQNRFALIEVDEAAFNTVSGQLLPELVVVTNFFRDQLDRYGELYSTVENVRSGIRKSPQTKLILNADDSLCSYLGKTSDNQAIYYGFKSGSSIIETNSDAAFCVFCKTEYSYHYRTYGHLGGFYCETCGYQRPESSLTCNEITELDADKSIVEISFGKDEPLSAIVNLPGLYNIYNALAAAACAYALEVPADEVLKAVGAFESSFGRMETINAGDKTIRLILVKNPAGFNQVINYLLTINNSLTAAFIINDRFADGTDISWLWDVNFEKLETAPDRINTLYTSGTRAEDMAVRLKYAGISTGRIKVQINYRLLLKELLDQTSPGGTLYILPTYTAMLEIRRLLRVRYRLEAFWK